MGADAPRADTPGADALRADTPRVEMRAVTRVLSSGGRDLRVVDGVDLAIGRRESVAILGPSGSGKSTLLALMAGLDRPSSGAILWDGERIDDRDEDALARLRRARLGFVFQSFQLLPQHEAIENVQVPLELLGERDAAARARALLERVGLGDRLHHRPAQLSGGEQQRVAIARAFVHAPAILLADEPTGNLDSANGAVVLDLLDELRASSGSTLVLVTHDEAVARRADRVLRLRDGKLAE